MKTMKTTRTIMTIAHISDLHFGREDPGVVAGLRDALWAAEPDLVVVSGDLTQRAKKRQFRAARSFLDTMPKVPRLVVPGNHDISATNMFERVVRPLTRYKRYITPDMSPFYSDEIVAIAGLDSVRLLSTKDGRLNRAQVEEACRKLAGVSGDPVRIVVTHHPMDLPSTDRRHPTLTRARMAMAEFARCGVDLFLSGHLHGGLSLVTRERYPLAGYSAVVAHAGTAASTRTRNEPNTFNLIRVETDLIDIEQMVWGGKRFAKGEIARYRKSADGWTGGRPIELRPSL